MTLTEGPDSATEVSTALDVASVVLVNAAGDVVGSAPKIEAHRPPGMLHSAFSIFVFDAYDRLLLHRRASSKYHFGGLWTNTCCSHPAPGEELIAAAHRRLDEELGMAMQSPQLSGRFQYFASDAVSGLVEHELDHVVCARAASIPRINPAEIDEIRWCSLGEVRMWLRAQPEAFTPWFGQALDLAIVPSGIDLR